MSDQIDAVSSTLQALGMDFRATAHNLANVSTAGYKRLRTSFAQTLQSQLESAEAVTGSLSIDFTQGALVRTGRPLDLAIQGKGFFVIETPEGRLYTRSGVFRTNAEGQLVDSAGRMVAGENGPITIPGSVGPQRTNVAMDGTVAAAGQQIGKLKLVGFADTSVLVPVGGNCFRPPADAVPVEAAASSVHQGCQEASNVSPVTELVRLITVTRMYEANLKGISIEDDRMRSLLQVAMGT